MKRLLIALSLLLCAAIAVPAVAKHGHGAKRPQVIQLPAGFQPEGIATGKRHTFYVGSVKDGTIWRGDLRTGEGTPLVQPTGLSATGLKVDKRNRLFVSAAGSKVIRVYDAATGTELRRYEVPDSAFVNDVVVTRRGAYFTDSGKKQLYFLRFGPGGSLPTGVETIPLSGDLVYDDDPGTFELNGIDKAKGGKFLIAVQSRNGKLFRIDPATGVTREIVLDQPVTNGDGILLKGRKLYVVRNQNNLVAVVKLRKNLSQGRYGRELKRAEFNVPTTIARSGGRFWVVNAKFGQNTPDQTYEVVQLPKR